MDSDSFIKKFPTKIWVPIKDGSMAEVGSGLPISNKHILTSLHVLALEKIYLGGSIKVEFPEQTSEHKEETPVFEVKKPHIFDGCKIVILELDNELPYDFEPLLVARGASGINSKSEWKAAGFPGYSDKSDDPLEDYTGTFEVVGKEQEIYQVKSNFYIENSQSLKGASGSVVVSNDVVVGCLEEHNDQVGNKLYLASFPYCYQKNENFKKFIDDQVYGESNYFYRTLEMFVPEFSKQVNGCESYFSEITNYLNIEVGGDDFKEFLQALSLNWSPKEGLFRLKSFLSNEEENFFSNLDNQSEKVSLWNSWVELTAMLARWMLLLSLKPEYREQGRSFNLKTLELKTPEFFEVIVSSQLMRCPEYELTSGNVVKPGNKELNPFAIYDSYNDKSLRAIYEYLFADLRGRVRDEYINKSDDELADLIVSDVLNKTDEMRLNGLIDGNYFIYYMIGEDSFKLIENDALFIEITDQLGDLLQFIVIASKTKKLEVTELRERRKLDNASYFLDRSLLLQLADIMNFKITIS